MMKFGTLPDCGAGALKSVGFEDAGEPSRLRSGTFVVEAALLDDGKFHEWLGILAEDVHYWMPTRYNRTRREREHEFSKPNEIAFFDEDKSSLAMRVKRLDTGMAWAEDPPSRTRHLVTNVQVRQRSAADEYDVTSSFLLYRTRLETDLNLFAGRRGLAHQLVHAGD